MHHKWCWFCTNSNRLGFLFQKKWCPNALNTVASGLTNYLICIEEVRFCEVPNKETHTNVNVLLHIQIGVAFAPATQHRLDKCIQFLFFCDVLGKAIAGSHRVNPDLVAGNLGSCRLKRVQRTGHIFRARLVLEKRWQNAWNILHRKLAWNLGRPRDPNTLSRSSFTGLLVPRRREFEERSWKVLGVGSGSHDRFDVDKIGCAKRRYL